MFSLYLSISSLTIVFYHQLDAYRKKKAAKKTNVAASASHANEEVVGEKGEGDFSSKSAPPMKSTKEEEEETSKTSETFAFTMAPDAVRYSDTNNSKTEEGEEEKGHTPIRPSAPEQALYGLEGEGNAAFMSPPPPRFSFNNEGYNADGSMGMEEEATPPVKMNLRAFVNQEEDDIDDRKKMSSLDESFDPEEYVNRFVTPEKKMAPPAKQRKATIDVPMEELEAIFRPTKTKDDYDDYVPSGFSKFLEKKNDEDNGADAGGAPREEQRLSSFEREILESKRRKEQIGGESSISDMLSRGSTLPPFGGGGSTSAGMSKLEQDEIISLQNMIDDLTTEKLSLKRGMDKNQKIIESLMEENESLTSAFNEAKNRNTFLEDQLNKLSSEMMLHSSVQQSISNDRDASRRGYIETRDRANELAREVVELEEVVLEYKSKLFLYENTQTDALERSKELERALSVANEDREYYQNLVEAMNEERREMQRRVGESNVIQALIESGDVPIVEMLQSWLNQVQAKAVSQKQKVSSFDSTAPEQRNESLEISTSEADFVSETRTSEAVATTKELIEALTRLASSGNGGGSSSSNNNSNADERAASSDGDDDDEEDGVVVDEAQIRLITSIHELLTEMEKETEIFRVKLKDAERREMGLRAANAALESRLARSADVPQAKMMTNTNAKESEDGRDDVIAAMRRINAGSAEPTPRPRDSNNSGGFRFRTGLVPDD